MKVDPFLRKRAILPRMKSQTEASSLRERQKELRRQHVTAFRRAIRRLREMRGPALGESPA